MKKEQINLGTVIANRELTDHNTGQPVHVSIGTPQFIGDGWDWACPFLITGLGEPIRGQAHGIDALQALQLVSAAIRSELEQSGAELSFLGQRHWQAAFPAQLHDLGSSELRARIETLAAEEQGRWLAEQGMRSAQKDC